MKTLSSRASALTVLKAIILLSILPTIHAQNLYWDINGVIAGAGGAAPSGIWGGATANWNGSSAGTGAATVWGAGSNAVFSAATDATGSYTVTLSGAQTAGALTFEEGMATLSGSGLTLNGTGFVTVNSGLKGTILSVLSGSVGLTKVGSGELVLGGINNFTGGLTNRAGTVTFDNDSAAGGGSVVLASTAQLSGTGGNTIFKTTTGATLTNPFNLQLNSYSAEFAPELNKTLTLNGVLSGSHPWSVNGLGTVRLGGNSANTSSGTITVAQGTLVILKSGALGPSGGQGTTVNMGATLAFDGGVDYSESEIVTVSGSGVGDLGVIRNLGSDNAFSGSIVLAADAVFGADAGYLGLVGPLSGGFNMTKVGPGGLDLYDPCSYGQTFVNEGTLGVWSPGSSGSGLVTVNSGARLEGDGNVTGGVNLSGILSPGASPAIISSGSQTWNSAATYEWEINDADGSAGTAFDQVNITGGLTIAANSGSPFNLQVISLEPSFNSSFPADNFDSASEKDWIIAKASGGITGFSADKFAIDDSFFLNNLDGGRFVVLQPGTNLVLRFDPAPVITANNLTQANDLNACGAVVNVAAAVSVTDNQPGWSVAYATNGATIAANCYFPVGTTAVDAVVTDSVGNTNATSFTVTVNDTQPPTVVTKNITIQLDATGNASITAAQVDNGSSDACEIATKTVTPSAFTCSDVGTQTVNLVVNDVHGNSATNTAQVTVEDKVAPTVLTQNITVQLDAGGNASITAAQVDNGSSDACEIATRTVTPSAFTCSDVGTQTVNLVVTDVHGNSATNTALVTVQDTLAPTVAVSPISVTLDAAGDYTLSATDINTITVGSTDNCTIQTKTVTPATFNYCNAGANPVEVVVTDANGNAATNNTTITVVAPSAPAVVYVDDNYGTGCGAVTWPATGGSGNYYIGYNAFNTVQAAVAAVGLGGTINAANGTYTLTTTLPVNKPLTFTGESQAGVILDASACGSSWGIFISASNTTLENFALMPPLSPPNNGAYAIHATPPEPVTVVSEKLENVVLRNISTASGHRTPFDLHGVDGVLLDGLSITGFIRGNGIQLTACDNVIVTNCTTTGNAWGGLAIYSSTYLQDGSSNISIDPSCTFNETSAIYLRPGAYSITGVTYGGSPLGTTFYTVDFGGGNLSYTTTEAQALALASAALTAGFPSTITAPSGTPIPFDTDKNLVQVDDNWSALPNGTPVLVGGTNFTIGFNAFTNIQAGVNAVITSGTVNVAAGNYAGEIAITKALALVGPNAGKAWNDVTRAPEAVIIPSVDDPNAGILIKPLASGIRIDGFIIDGRNDDLSGGFALINGVVTHAYKGIENAVNSAANGTPIDHFVFENNIVRNLKSRGMICGRPVMGDPVSAFNYVRFNKFENIRGEGLQFYGNMAADISHNRFEGMNRGISMHNLNNSGGAWPAFQPQISDNRVLLADNGTTGNYTGIWLNHCFYSGVSMLVNSNTVEFAASVPAASKTAGIWMTTIHAGAQAVFQDNTIIGNGVMDHGYYGGTLAIEGNVVIKGGSITGVTTSGIAVENVDNYSTFGFNTGADGNYLTVDGVAITVNSTATGLRSIYSTANPNGSIGRITVKGGTTISGSGIGAIADGPRATIAFSGASPASFDGALSSYISLINAGATDPAIEIDATGVSFAGQLGSAMNLTDLFATENKIQHKVDDASLGLVRVKAANVYVTTASGSIQRGIDAATAGDTVNVDAGTFVGSLLVDKSLTLVAPGGWGATTVEGTVGDAIKVDADNVTVHGFTVRNPAIRQGIYAKDHSHIVIADNRVMDIGLTDAASAPGYGIAVESASALVDDVRIIGNLITNVVSVRSAQAIVAGFTPGLFDITGLVIASNRITQITSTTKGAYGIQLNHTHNVGGGTTVAPQIFANEITGLSGAWAHGVGLEGNTPNAVVSGNLISGLIGGSDAIGVQVEDNSSASTVTISGNSFSNLVYGVQNVTSYPVNAVSNWWGNLTGPSSAALNLYGTGVGVTGNVTISPWLASGTDTSVAIGFQPTAPVNYQPMHLAFSAPPVGAPLGSLLSQQPVVQVLDANNIVTPWVNTNITVAIGNNPGFGILTGSTNILSISGIATYTDLSVTVGGGAGFTLVASAPSLSSATSAPFDIGNPPPSIASLNPAGAVTGSGNVSVTIAGANFVPNSVVLVNDSPVTKVFNSATQLTATLDTTMAGSYSVIVSNPPTSGGISGPLTFTVGGQPAIVWVDDSFTPASSGGHSWGFDAFATIADGIAAVSSGGTVNVAAGTYAAVNANKSVILLGANVGTACGGSGDSVINGGAGAAITIGANNVTVDGFALTGANGVSDTGFSGAVVQNNKINTSTQGVAMQGIAGTFTIQDNCITLSNQLAGVNPTVGIAVAGTAGGATVIKDNNIAGAFYGYVLYGVNNTPAVTVKGGTITGVMQGVAVINVGPAPFTTPFPSTFAVDSVSMSGFSGSYPGTFHAGIYVYSGGASTSADLITGTITNVTVTGTGKPGANSAGLSFADFSTNSGARQAITVMNSTLSGNKNRGVDVTGKNASVTITGCTLTDNGGDPFATGGNDGFGVIVRNGAQVTVTETFITNPATQVAGTVTALATMSTGTNPPPELPSLTINNSSILQNGNGKLAAQSAGTLNGSGNWWGGTSDTAIAALMSGTVDFTPYLASGTDLGGNPANGFQGDFSTLHVTLAGAQTGTTGRIQEGHDMVSGSTVYVEAGNYAEAVLVSKSVTFRGPNYLISPRTGTRVAEAVLTGAAPAFRLVDYSSDTLSVEGFKFETTPVANYHQANSTLNFARNLVTGPAAGAVFVSATSPSSGNTVTITDNRFASLGVASSSAMQAFMAGVSSSVSITENEINGTPYAGILVDGGATVLVSCNDVQNTPRQGIQVAGAAGNVSVLNNSLTACNTSGDADRGGIRLYGSLFTGTVNVSGNTISGSHNGVAIKNGENLTGKDIHITGNAFSGNTGAGVYHGGSGALDAQNNWWGHNSGPAIASNANASGAPIGGAGAGSVDYSPWLATDTDLYLACGFQADLGQLNYTPAYLVFSTQPGGANLGGSLLPQPVVTVKNEIGGTATQFTGPITNAIAYNPDGGVLAGNVAVSAVNGVATFTDLAINTGGGSGYTLAASTMAPITNAISAAFNVTNPPPILDSISPIWAAAGSGNFTLTLNGSGFVPSSMVMWGASPKSPASFAPNQLTVLIPSTDIVTAGTVSVTVFSPSAGGGTSAAHPFTITPTAVPNEVWVDNSWTGPANSGSHIWGYDAFATVQGGVDGVASGGIVNVAAGTYAAVNANHAVTLKGANYGVAGCSHVASESTIAGITISAADVTVDGFELTGVTAVSNTGNTGAVVQNNKITADAVGISMQNIAGAFTVKDNCVNLPGMKELGSNPTIGLLFGGISGAGQIVAGNTVTGPFYGYLLADVDAAAPLAITGGSIGAVMQGVAVINYNANFSAQANSTFTLDGVTMSGFTGTSANAGRNFHAGVYVYTGGSDNTATVTGLITNVTVTGTGKIQNDCAGLSFADFTTVGGTRQTIMVLNSMLSNNLNRGINVRGTNALVTITGSTLTGNGNDPYGTNGNDGFGIIARLGATVNVSETFIANPATQLGYTVTALAIDAGSGAAPVLTVSNSSIDNNGNTSGKLAMQSGGTLNGSGNWWGGTSDTTISARMSGSVDFTPYLASGTDSSTNAGFQGDFSTLHVTTLAYQPAGGRIQEGINLVSGSKVIIEAGAYVENVLANKNNLELAGVGQALVTVVPALSGADTGGGSLGGGASSIILVQANNVKIHDLALDGNNSLITSGALSGGIDVEARNGIITDHSLSATYNGLEVYNTTVKNIYLRGIYASSGGTFNLHDNTVQNVQGDPGASIAIFNFGGSGVISNNIVSDAIDAIAANWSTGTQFRNNTVTASGSGVHTDNNYNTADLLEGNNISAMAIDGYGVWVYSPYVPVLVQSNIVNDCVVGLMSARQNAAVSPVFQANQVDCGSIPNSVGAYVTTEGFGWGSENVGATFLNNTILNADYGIYVNSETASNKTAAVSLASNSINSVDYGVFVDGALAKMKVENNNLAGNTVAGIWATNGAVVDAGACSGPDILGGLGISSGGNDLTGYLTTGNAIVNSGSTVRAYGNSFGATAGSPSISGAFTGTVSASQSGGLLVTPTVAGSTVQCIGDLPAAETTLAGFISLGGAVSATAGVTVSSSDDVVAGPYEGQVVRTYVLTDACGQTNAATQTFTVDDTIAPVVTTWPTNRTLNVNGQCQVQVPNLTTEVVATDNCSLQSTNQNPPALTWVSLGVTNVTVTVADNGGNSVSTNVVLTIVDTSLAPLVTYVDDDYTNMPSGTVVTISGNPHYVGCDAFGTIQAGINRVAANGTVNVAAGTYMEDVSIAKTLSLLGAGMDTTTIVGVPNNGNPNTVGLAASGVLMEGFKITRAGNDIATWTANLNDQGVHFGNGGNCTVRLCKFEGNRNAVYMNTTSGNTFDRNVVINNRTGMQIVNNLQNNVITGNTIHSNWTLGILINSPSMLDDTAGLAIQGNSIQGNWYAQIENRSPNGLKDFSGNWLGTSSPTVTNGAAGEPGYSALIPVAFGGTAVPPATSFTIAGVASANVDYTPWLDVGTDMNVAMGFQGDFSTLHVNASSAQVGATGRIQEGINLVSGGTSTVNVHSGTYIEGPQVLVDKNVNLVGDGLATTIVTPAGNTTVGGNVPSEAWVYVQPTMTASISGISFDGAGKQINHAIQSRGNLTISSCEIKNIKWGQYNGRGIVAYTGTLTVQNSSFANIERIGIHVRGAVVTPPPVATITGSTFTGKGAGDWLDYGVEVGGGGEATIQGCNFNGNLGIASVDNSGSAGVLITTYFGLGTKATLLNNTITGHSVGVSIGYDNADASRVMLQGNDLTGNTDAGIQVVGAAVVDAGDLLARNLTGLGSSTGGNNLAGYGFNEAAPWAIDASGTVAPGQVVAYANNFGAAVTDNINTLITDGFGGTGVIGEFSQAGSLTSVAPSNVVVQCAGSIPAAATTLAGYIALGGVVSANPITVNSSDTVHPTADGSVTRTYTLVDAMTRTNVVTQLITVDDITAPQFTTSATNQTLVADVNAQAQIPDVTSQVVATDNCGSVSLSQVPLAGTVVGLGSHPVTVWAADQGGNSNSCSATITVIDQTAPVLTVPANVTVTTLQDKDPYATGYATATDANGPVTIAYNDSRAGLTNCNATGDIVRTWTATDASANVSTGVQTVTVIDTNAPVFTYLPANITVTNDLNLCSAVVNFAPTAMDLDYFQGFENPNWLSGNSTQAQSTDWNDYNSSIYRVVSGTDGITSKSGSAHALIDCSTIPVPRRGTGLNETNGNLTGAFGRLGGYYGTFGNGFRSAVSVYIDLNDPTVATNGYGFDLDTAPATPSLGFGPDYIFHVASDTSGNILIAADRNSGQQKPDLSAVPGHGTITNSGWFTFEWNFRNTNGVLAVDFNLRDASQSLVWTKTISEPGDLIPSTIGGNRYMWFTYATPEKLAIDDSVLERNATLTSDLASGSAFPVGTTTVTNLAVDACGNGTNATFTVTVLDQQPPAIAPIANIVVTNSVGNCTVAVSYAPISPSDNCGLATTNFVPADGSSFPVGITPVSVSVTDIHGNSTTNSFTVTVVDATATAIASSLTQSTYGNAVTFTATVSACPAIPITGSNVTFTEGMTTLGTATLDGANQAAITLTNLTAGTHLITASYAGDAAHVGSTSVVLTQVVNQAELTVAGITAQDKVYDGNPVAVLNLPGATLVTPVPGDDVNLVTTGAAGAFDNKNIGMNKPVAITGLTIAGTAAGNYSLTQPATTADITAAPLVPAITAADKVYDGNAVAVITSRSVTGIVGIEDVSLTGGTATFAGASAGTWTVTGSGFTLAGVDAGNYAIVPTTAATSATINPAALTITANSTNKVYGVNLVFAGTEFSVTGLTNSETVTGVTLNSAGATNTAGVGSYAIAPSLATGSLNTNNYSISYLNGTLIVTPADLLVNADNAGRLYGQTNPVFTATYTGFVNSETKATSDVVGEPSLTTIAETNSPVGTYDILTAIGTLASTNYNLILSNGTLTVGQAMILVQADNTNRLYGSANPVFTATYSGFLNGDTASVLSGAPALSTDANTNSPVGAYVITNLIGTLSATNYVFALSNGVLTVEATALLVKANDASKTYDAVAYTGGNGVTYTGFVNGETDAVLGGTLSYAGDSQGATNVGTYTITPQGLTSANYSLTFSNATLTIEPQAATVVADAKVKTYLANNPTLTAVVTGQVAGGDVIAYALATTATTASTVGSYDITVTLGGNPNYSVTATNSTLTVNPATPVLTITSASPINYGQPLSASIIAGSAANPNDSSSVAGAFTFTTPATVPAATASQAVTFTPTDVANYTSASGTVIVPVVDPAIVSQPLSVTQALGGNVSFSVSAVGTPTLHYQWQQNNVNLPGQTASTLALNSIANSAAGNYRVIITNVTGAVTSSVAVLTITEPPVFTQQPANLVVNQGQSAQFQVNVNGTSPFAYQWLKNGLPLANGGNILGALTRTLIINPAAASDDASYSVRVTNVHGTNLSASATLTVIVPPAITFQPLSITNNADTTAMFVVSNTGSPSVYRWYKNGTNLTDLGNVYGSSTPVLTLSNVLGADRANYSVVISNAAAVVTSSNAALWVIDPIITSQPASLVVNATSNATFTVGYVGTPPSFQWRTNGVPLGGATSQTLALNNVSQSMAAVYSVVVSNQYGVVVSSNATLAVIDPPVIVTQPASLTVNATSNATFVVSYTGTAPSFQWYKGASPISGETADSLTLLNVSQLDAAGYSVVLSNAAGVVTSSAATLTVIDGPVIIGQPASLTVNATSNATFTVAYTGTAPSFQWYKGLAPIGGQTAASLTLLNVSQLNAAGYSVVLSNAAGVVTSTVATLTVIDGPVITGQPLSITNNAGTTATFIVAHNGSAADYRWLKNGTNLSNGLNIYGATTATLTLSNVFGMDQGVYSVVVSNAAAVVTSSGATLTVIDPFIATQPAGVTNITGSTVNFSVTTVGTEPMSYQWYQDGVPLFFQTNSTLALVDIAGGDAGYYTVIITNVYGSATSAPAVLVTVPPLIVTQPVSLTRNLGQSASFSVAVNGATPFSYQWYKDGTNLVNAMAGETNVILSFASVQASDQGSYRVHVTNPLGEQWSDAATLTVIVPPAITSQPASLTVNATSNATFTVGYTGTAPAFQWFANGSPLSGATSNPLILTNVSQADALDYTVVLSNAAGSATSAPPAHLTVIDPPVIGTQPTNIVALVGDNVSFNVSASGTAPLAYQWYHNSNSVPSATADTLNLTGVTTNDAGVYYVTVTNPAGVATSSLATLSVYTTTVPVLSICYSNHVAVVELVGVPTYPYAIQASTNLTAWTAIQTNPSPFSLVETNESGTGNRFYRGIYLR